MSIRTAIVVDPFSTVSEPEDDWATIQSVLEGKMALPVEVVETATDIGDVKARADLLVIDYGGIGLSGAGMASAYQMRDLYKWADEHPGSIVLLWTVFTADQYEEVAYDCEPQDNVWMCAHDTREAVGAKLRAWFAADVKAAAETEVGQ